MRAGVLFTRSLFFIFLATLPVLGASNPRGHYADGQVWIVWDIDFTPLPASYSIYSSPNRFTDVSQATLAGRLFAVECVATMLKTEADKAFGGEVLRNFVIPTAEDGTYELRATEGLFVETVRETGARYYAVVPFGQTTVSDGDLTDAPVSFRHAAAEPPKPHLQIRANSTTGHKVSFFTLWVDGDQNENAGRSDFPIMANQAKRGSPHTMLTVEPLAGLQGNGPWSATVCLHGGNSSATHWLPSNDGQKSINTVPTDGIIVGFDDDLFRSVEGGQQGIPITTGHMGYARELDPFDYSLLRPGSTIVNYTQRRYIYFLDWLIKRGVVDAHRISLLGHSNGAQGAMMLSKVYPEYFSNVQLFNCTMRLYQMDSFISIYGTTEDNLPTSIINGLGEPVRMLDLTSFSSHISPVRDRPFLRHYAGKCDNNNDIQWGEVMLNQMRYSDREGLGLHFYWDLRKHGLSEWRDYWVDASSGATLVRQTQRDDVRNQSRYRNDQSYPAFFNLQNYPNHGEPGPGYLGGSTLTSPCGLARDDMGNLVNNGDDHGTWGGYFDWETDSILDMESRWECTVFLVSNASGYAEVDQSPHPVLQTDIAIRRPQWFRPIAGRELSWESRIGGNESIAQNGRAVVRGDGLVSITGINVPRDPARLRLSVSAILQPCPAPLLSVRIAGEGVVELSWPTCDGVSYQVESLPEIEGNWLKFSQPLAAGANGILNYNLLNEGGHSYFRLRTEPLLDSQVPEAPGTYNDLAITVNGLSRRYHLYLPPAYNSGARSPLAFLLHGHGQTGKSFAFLHPDLFPIANNHNMILVFPEGTEGREGTGWSIFDPWPPRFYIDDVSFITNLLERLDSRLALDRKRIFAGGFSMGGSMAYYLAGKTKGIFAAYAAVESSLGSDRNTGTDVFLPPVPLEPMPVLIMNATNSCTRPYYGGVNLDGTYMTPAIDAAHHWTNANLCEVTMSLTMNNFVTNGMRRFANCDDKPPANVPQPNQVIVQKWETCAPGTEVIFITLTDGGHIWPDEKDNVGFDANKGVLEFFMKHHRQ